MTLWGEPKRVQYTSLSLESSMLECGDQPSLKQLKRCEAFLPRYRNRHVNSDEGSNHSHILACRE